MNLPSEPTDPNVDQAMAEMKAIIEKYDLGCVVALCSPTHSSYMVALMPTWSALTLSSAPDGSIHCRLKCAMKTGDAKEKEKGRLTAGLVLGLLDALDFVRGQLSQVSVIVGKLGKISHVSQQTVCDKIKIEEEDSHDHQSRTDRGLPPPRSD